MSNESLIIEECIHARDRITEFILPNADNDDFRRGYRELYNFFLQSGFYMYVYRFKLRLYKVEHMARLLPDFRQKFYVESNFLPKLREKNEKCLEFAQKVKRFTEEQFRIFKDLSRKYHADAGKYDFTTNSLKSFAKSVIGFGTKANYEKMVHGIPPCFYPLMDKFADSILTYEDDLAKSLGIHVNSPGIVINRDFLAEWGEKLSVDRLLEKLQNSLDQLSNPQGAEEVQFSDRQGAEEAQLSDRKISEQIPPPPLSDQSEESEGGSRRHRRHTHRRHHSKHSHKSVKRSKKGKKVMKSHTRKRHAHVRNQNKRRNRSIK